MFRKALMLILLLASVSYGTISELMPQSKPYTCDGNDTTFEFSFPINAAEKSSALQVIKYNTDTNDTTYLAYSTDYSVSADDDDYSSGGLVTTRTAYDANYTITIVRRTPLTQTASFITGGRLNTITLGNSFDKLTMQVQDVNAGLGRCLRVSPTDTNSILVIPSASERADMYAAYDSNGDPIATAGPTGDSNTPVSTFVSALFSDASASEFRDSIGLGSSDYEATVGFLSIKSKDPFVDVRAYGATGDGVTDDTSAITSAIAAAANSVLLFPDGTYEVNGLTIATPMEIWMFEGATIELIADSNTNIFTVSSGSVSFHGGRLDGNIENQGANTSSAIYTSGASNITIKDVNITDVNGTGIQIRGTTGASNIDIEDCVLSTCRQYSIYYDCNGGSNIKVKNCTVNQSDESGSAKGSIHVVGATGNHITSADLSHNHVNMTNASSVYYGVVLTYADDSIVHHNKTFGGASGIGIAGCNGISCVGNIVSSPTSYGIEVGSATTDCTVSGCVVDGDSGDTGYGILVTTSGTTTDRNIIIGNRIIDCGTYGIDVATGPPHHTVISNNVIECGSSSTGGIRLADANYCVISNNTIEGDGHITAGIGCLRTSYLSVTGNTVDDTTVAGIQINNNAAGEIDYISIVGNTLGPNTTVPIRDINSNAGTLGSNIEVWGNAGSIETETTGTVNLTRWGTSFLNGNAGAVTATLPDGYAAGTIKTIVCVDSNNTSTVTVTSHDNVAGIPTYDGSVPTGDGEVGTFDAVDEAWILIWTGTEWTTLRATCTF